MLLNQPILSRIRESTALSCTLSMSNSYNALACQMDGERWSHGLSAEGTKNKVMRPNGLQTSWLVRPLDF